MQESDHPILIYRRKRGTTHELYSPQQKREKQEGKSKKGKSEAATAFDESWLPLPFAFLL
jgi:hypothetical protein